MNDQKSEVTRRNMLIAGASAAGLTLLARGAAPVFAQHTQVSSSFDGPNNWKDVAAVFGVEGMIEPGNVFAIDLPRTDLQIRAFGISLKPDLGFDSEITFQHIRAGAIVKYEFVLRDREVIPVLDALFAQGLQPATSTLNALHNHFIELRPKIKFLHGTAIGDPVSIAKALRQALSHSGQPFVSSSPGETGLPNKEIEKIIGGMGTIEDSVLNVTVERKETIREFDIVLQPAMQVESLFHFQSIEHGQAAVNAEFVLLASEVDAVSRIMRERGFFVMAVHNHELFEQPKLYYVHTFGTGSPQQLAHAIRDALNKTNSKFM